MTLLADYATHPPTYGFQTARPLRRLHGFLPDAVTDTTAKRKRKAAVLLGDGCGVLIWLWLLDGYELWHVVARLPRSLDFYGEAPAVGRAELRALFPDAPALALVAYGRRRRSHLHALVAVKQGTVLPKRGTFGRLFARRVKDAKHLENLALYFSRPADERAARPDRQAFLRYTREELRTQRLDASDMYLEAKSRLGRLPHTRWRQNIPRKMWPELQHTAPEPVAFIRPELPEPRVPHVDRLPAWVTTWQRLPRTLFSARLTLAQPKHAQVQPRARSPPRAGGQEGPTVPFPRLIAVRPPNGLPIPATHPGHEGATPGDRSPAQYPPCFPTQCLQTSPTAACARWERLQHAACALALAQGEHAWLCSVLSSSFLQ